MNNLLLLESILDPITHKQCWAHECTKTCHNFSAANAFTMDNDLRDIQNINNAVRRRVLHRRPFNGPRPNFFEKYNDREFKKRHRLSKEHVRFLIELLDDQLNPQSTRRNCLTTEQQVFITLRYMASGIFQLVCGDLCEVAQPTVSKTVAKVARCIAHFRECFIRMPSGDAEIQEIKDGFQRIANFPNVIGCIDCTHVPIIKPSRNAAAFYGRKRYSINVQLVCDHNLKIRNVVARWGGSTHDSRIFKNSRLYGDCMGGTLNGMLLGDSGYACTSFMMTPVLRPGNAKEENYNRAHIRTRNTVERTIGVTKSQFRCTSRDSRLRIRKERAMAVVVASCVLHNISLEPNIDVLRQQARHAPIRNANQRPHFDRRRGPAVRQELINRHF